MSRLFAQNIHCQRSAKRVGDDVNPSFLLKAWIILAPKSVDTICLGDDCFYHFLLVVAQIIRNVKHHVTDQISDCRNTRRRDIVQGELIDIGVWLIWVIFFDSFKCQIMSPIDLNRKSA